MAAFTFAASIAYCHRNYAISGFEISDISAHNIYYTAIFMSHSYRHISRVLVSDNMHVRPTDAYIGYFDTDFICCWNRCGEFAQLNTACPRMYFPQCLHDVFMQILS